MLNIFITNLALYNAGYLAGEWVELPISESKLDKIVNRISRNGKDELFITDYESDINGLTIGEYDNINELNEIAEQLKDLDDYEIGKLGALLNYGYSLEDAIDKIDDCIYYEDCYDMGAVAEQYCEECGILDDIPEHLRCYFDFDAYGCDMEIEGHYVFTNGGCVQI